MLFLNSKEKSIAQERLPKQSLKIGVSLYRADDEFIEFAGEKTHYFNGGMIARRRTVRM